MRQQFLIGSESEKVPVVLLEKFIETLSGFPLPRHSPITPVLNQGAAIASFCFCAANSKELVKSSFFYFG